jgi:uncharacterized membrane-anchored protein YitT (DUF2179 family)
MNEWSKEVIMLIAGCLFYVISTILINPVDIVPGSVLGISVVAHSLFGISIGTVNVICNVPIMILCTIYFGKKILIYTILIIISTSALIDWWLPLFPVVFADYGWGLAILGGGLMGAGAGLLMRAGGTMGGTTAVGRILQKKNPKINMGSALFIMDTAIIIAGAVLLNSFTGFLYSIVYTFVCAKVIDFIYSYKRGSSSKELGLRTQEG